jgi:hypothetical protein
MKDIEYKTVYVLFDEKGSYFIKPILEIDDLVLFKYSEYLSKLIVDGDSYPTMMKSKKNLEYLLNNTKFKNGLRGIIQITDDVLDSVGSDKKVDINFPFVEKVFTPKKNVKSGDVNWFLDYLVKIPKKEEFRDWRINFLLA